MDNSTRRWDAFLTLTAVFFVVNLAVGAPPSPESVATKCGLSALALFGIWAVYGQRARLLGDLDDLRRRRASQLLWSAVVFFAGSAAVRWYDGQLAHAAGWFGAAALLAAAHVAEKPPFPARTHADTVS
jgi:hypothetical protein